MTAQQKESREYYLIFREQFGEMVSLTELGKIIGYRNLRTVRQWADSEHLEPVQVGRKIKYFSREVAKCLVAKKGMV